MPIGRMLAKNDIHPFYKADSIAPTSTRTLNKPLQD
jgi:hypothetical protein